MEIKTEWKKNGAFLSNSAVHFFIDISPSERIEFAPFYVEPSMSYDTVLKKIEERKTELRCAVDRYVAHRISEKELNRPLKTYHGPHGEVVTANDEAGLAFLSAYARYAAGDEHRQREALKMLAAVVCAAGGEVRVPRRSFIWPGLNTRIEISEDAATMDLVFKAVEVDK